MNKVILMGRLTTDPELRQTPSGVGVVRFTLAVSRRFKKDETDFINCIAWRATADFICKYFNKGDMMAAIGSMQVRSWEDKDGKKMYATEVIADEVYFTGAKTTGTDNARPLDNNKSVSDEEFEMMGLSIEDASEGDDLPF